MFMVARQIANSGLGVLKMKACKSQADSFIDWLSMFSRMGVTVLFVLFSVSCPLDFSKPSGEKPDDGLDIIVGPEGGTYDIGEDISLFVPRDAVQSNTPLGIRHGDIAKAMQVLSPFSLTDEDIISCIQGLPDGQLFAVPIVIRISNLDVEPGTVPFVHQVAIEDNSYQPAECEVTLDPDAGLLEISLSHFTDYVVHRSREMATEQCDDEPCRCGKIHVKQSDLDLTCQSGECQISKSSVEIAYLDCQYAEKYNYEEISPGCKPTLDVIPSSTLVPTSGTIEVVGIFRIGCQPYEGLELEFASTWGTVKPEFAKTSVEGQAHTTFTANDAPGQGSVAATAHYSYYLWQFQAAAGGEVEEGYGTLIEGKLEEAVSIEVVDDEAPIPGNDGKVAIANTKGTSLSLQWSEASDDRTSPSDLEYRVVMSSSPNIGALGDAEANGTVIRDWLKDHTEFVATGLQLDTQYYFNVLVRDEVGNRAAYVMVQARTEDRDTTMPIPGDGGKILVSDTGMDYMALGWTKATDNHTPQAELQYKIVSSMNDDIGTVEQAEANGAVVRDWTSDTQGLIAQDLECNTWYWFNVLVRDLAGNKAAYRACGEKTLSPPGVEEPRYTLTWKASLADTAEYSSTAAEWSGTAELNADGNVTDLSHSLSYVEIHERSNPEFHNQYTDTYTISKAGEFSLWLGLNVSLDTKDGISYVRDPFRSLRYGQWTSFIKTRMLMDADTSHERVLTITDYKTCAGSLKEIKSKLNCTQDWYPDMGTPGDIAADDETATSFSKQTWVEVDAPSPTKVADTYEVYWEVEIIVNTVHTDVSAIEIQPSSTSPADPLVVPLGSTLQLQAVVKDLDGESLSNRTVAWNHIGGYGATISPSGTVTAQRPGTAKFVAECEGKMAVVDVLVPGKYVLVWDAILSENRTYTDWEKGYPDNTAEVSQTYDGTWSGKAVFDEYGKCTDVVQIEGHHESNSVIHSQSSTFASKSVCDLMPECETFFESDINEALALAFFTDEEGQLRVVDPFIQGEIRSTHQVPYELASYPCLPSSIQVGRESGCYVVEDYSYDPWDSSRVIDRFPYMGLPGPIPAVRAGKNSSSKDTRAPVFSSWDGLPTDLYRGCPYLPMWADWTVTVSAERE
jgi:hypothetical protein